MSTTTYKMVIGLEVHVQLSTASKLFSDSPNYFNPTPNTNLTHYDTALPGQLPILNIDAVQKAITFGLAVGATINRNCYFERKNYFYPDLPKGYQISQNDHPIVSKGTITFTHNNTQHTVRLTRAHLEEDAGKLIHHPHHSEVDLNRAGVPLLEIVSEPDLTTAGQAAAYLKTLHQLVRTLNISEAQMQLGQFRCDVNISIRKQNHDPLGTRVEIKNLNSFKFVEEAIEAEYTRQCQAITNNQQITQETRLYNPDNKTTKAMRSKEMAHDYRYFPDPDLPPLSIDQAWIDTIKQNLPQTQEQKLQTLQTLSQDDQQFFLQTKDAYEYLTQLPPHLHKQAVPHIRQALIRHCNQHHTTLLTQPLTPHHLTQIITATTNNTISTHQAKEILATLLSKKQITGNDLDTLINNASQQQQQANAIDLTPILTTLLNQYPKQAEQLKAGKNKIHGFFVGKAMAETKGKADPSTIAKTLNQIIKQHNSPH